MCSLLASALAALAVPGGPAVLARCRRCAGLLASALAALAVPGGPAVLARCRRCAGLLASALAALAVPGGPAVLARCRLAGLIARLGSGPARGGEHLAVGGDQAGRHVEAAQPGQGGAPAHQRGGGQGV